MTEELEKKLDCLILLSCMSSSSEDEKLKVAVNCLGLKNVARLLGKDNGNLSRKLNKGGKKKNG